MTVTDSSLTPLKGTGHSHVIKAGIAGARNTDDALTQNARVPRHGLRKSYPSSRTTERPEACALARLWRASK